MNHFAEAVDNLDAAIFSGDGLFDAENRDLLKRSMERWRRQLVVWEKIALDETTEPEPHGPAPDPE